MNQAEITWLRWYVSMGVDELVSERPADWYNFTFKEALKEDPQPPESSRRSSPAQLMAPDAALMAARDHARSTATLRELEEMVARFDGCGLKTTAKNTCFKRGSDDADIMFIGEAPGRDEDLQGRPFVGRAGKLLDKMLSAIALSEEDVYITNIVYWRPPGNRTPTPQEALVCRPFLERQIELVDPSLLVFLGGAASKHMLATNDGIMRLRGKWRSCQLGDKSYRAMATLHPAYLLRNPAAKRLAWRDMLALREALNEMKNDPQNNPESGA